MTSLGGQGVLRVRDLRFLAILGIIPSASFDRSDKSTRDPPFCCYSIRFIIFDFSSTQLRIPYTHAVNAQTN